MSRDEFRHSASAGDVLKKRIDRDPAVAAQVLAAAERFRHYGSDVVDVPVAEENDFEAIMADEPKDPPVMRPRADRTPQGVHSRWRLARTTSGS